MFWIQIIVICAFYEYEVSSSYIYAVFSCVLYSFDQARATIILPIFIGQSSFGVSW